LRRIMRVCASRTTKRSMDTTCSAVGQAEHRQGRQQRRAGTVSVRGVSRRCRVAGQQPGNWTASWCTVMYSKHAGSLIISRRDGVN
jgi:hypothetical protein